MISLYRKSANPSATLVLRACKLLFRGHLRFSTVEDEQGAARARSQLETESRQSRPSFALDEDRE